MSEQKVVPDIGLDLIINKKSKVSNNGTNDDRFSDIAVSDDDEEVSGGGGGSGNQEEGEEEEYEEYEGDEYEEQSNIYNQSNNYYNKKKFEEERMNKKKTLLYQFDRLEKKGVRLPKVYTMESDLNEMEADYDKIVREKEVDNSILFQRKMLMGFVTGIEYLNTKFDPFSVKLDGWSENIHDEINGYDDIFEELHDKYSGTGHMAPELRLLFSLGGSAFMFHLTNTMFKNSLPGVEEVFKQNPNLMKQFASATMNTMAGGGNKSAQNMSSFFFNNNAGGKAPPGNGSASALGSGMFSTNTVVPPRQQPRGDSARKMQGPTNVDEILRNLEKDINNNETMSMVTDSDNLSDLPDNVSISGSVNVSSPKRRRAKQRKTLNL
jgi:hypothetical protein